MNEEEEEGPLGINVNKEEEVPLGVNVNEEKGPLVVDVNEEEGPQLVGVNKEEGPLGVDVNEDKEEPVRADVNEEGPLGVDVNVEEEVDVIVDCFSCFCLFIGGSGIRTGRGRFLGDANLFPIDNEGRFDVSPFMKCLEHTLASLGSSFSNTCPLLLAFNFHINTARLSSRQQRQQKLYKPS